MIDGLILEATAALATAVQRGDAAAAGDTYTSDAKLLTPAPELICGQADIEAYWRTGIAVGVSSLGLEREALETVAVGVVEAGRYTLCADAAVVERGTYLVLHEQTPEGFWRRAIDVFHPDHKEVEQ